MRAEFRISERVLEIEFFKENWIFELEDDECETDYWNSMSIGSQQFDINLHAKDSGDFSVSVYVVRYNKETAKYETMLERYEVIPVEIKG